MPSRKNRLPRRPSAQKRRQAVGIEAIQKPTPTLSSSVIATILDAAANATPLSEAVAHKRLVADRMRKRIQVMQQNPIMRELVPDFRNQLASVVDDIQRLQRILPKLKNPVVARRFIQNELPKAVREERGIISASERTTNLLEKDVQSKLGAFFHSSGINPTPEAVQTEIRTCTESIQRMQNYWNCAKRFEVPLSKKDWEFLDSQIAGERELILRLRGLSKLSVQKRRGLIAYFLKKAQ